MQALSMFSSIARCFARAFTTGVPGGTYLFRNANSKGEHVMQQALELRFLYANNICSFKCYTFFLTPVLGPRNFYLVAKLST